MPFQTTDASWPPAARALGGAVQDAVTALTEADADALAEARARLLRVDREQLATLLGSIGQQLVERALPDGLDAAEAEQLLARARRDSRWLTDVDADLPDEDILVRALIAVLGLPEPEDAPPAPGDLLVLHGLLLVVALLPTAGCPLSEVLAHGLAELRRAQTMELP